MKRELKFRVFNGFEMNHDVVVGRFGNFFVNPSNNGISENDSACLSEANTKYADDIPVMQYTGLKDKNGKEIWEGDILKLIDINVSVFFNSATASFDFQYEGGDCESLYSNIEAGIEMEVIGNIYENPELLKQS